MDFKVSNHEYKSFKHVKRTHLQAFSEKKLPLIISYYMQDDRILSEIVCLTHDSFERPCL